MDRALRSRRNARSMTSGTTMGQPGAPHPAGKSQVRLVEADTTVDALSENDRPLAHDWGSRAKSRSTLDSVGSCQACLGVGAARRRSWRIPSRRRPGCSHHDIGPSEYLIDIHRRLASDPVNNSASYFPMSGSRRTYRLGAREPRESVARSTESGRPKVGDPVRSGGNLRASSD
jgi:hypothetical protein